MRFWLLKGGMMAEIINKSKNILDKLEVKGLNILSKSESAQICTLINIKMKIR